MIICYDTHNKWIDLVYAIHTHIYIHTYICIYIHKILMTLYFIIKFYGISLIISVKLFIYLFRES